ncbi:hypothetical protein [Kitasatospora sp. NPDC051914]|uniref:hypothetical protein n=1 Tax=Kitasatospora sp. NPDC051914 TaxID=3154945 RepID=UPI00342F40A2
MRTRHWSALLGAAAILTAATIGLGWGDRGPVEGAGPAAASPTLSTEHRGALLAASAVVRKAGSVRLSVADEAPWSSTGVFHWGQSRTAELVRKRDYDDEQVAMRVVDRAFYIGQSGEGWARVPLGADSGKEMDPVELGAAQIAVFWVIDPLFQLDVHGRLGSVVRQGDEKVDGALAVHYRSTVETFEFVEAIGDDLSLARQLGVRLALHRRGNTMAADFWIGPSGEVLKMAVGLPTQRDVSSEVRYSDYGRATAVQAPPPAEILNPNG